MFSIRHIFILSILVVSCNSFAQEHALLWQRSVGNSGEDDIASVITDHEENIYVLGSVQTENSGHDLYLLKMDEGGNEIWQKQFGGSGDETGAELYINNDGTVIILGTTNSKDEFHPTGTGYEDILLMKVSSSGALISKNFYGGDFIDVPTSIISTGNGNYLISAYSRSNNGDLSGNFGQYDMWILEINSYGSIIWQRNYGATDEDMAIKVLQQKDGTYMILGQSTSYDGAYSDNRGDNDIVLIKIDDVGNILWQHSYGGFLSDEAKDILQLENGNVLVVGSTFSYQFDVETNHGGSDVWLIEVDQQSHLIWEKTYGSYGNEYAASLARSESGFFIFGTSNSSSISSNYNNGEQDFWLYEIDEQNREIIDMSFFGASGFESGSAFSLLTDGSLLLAGNSNSKDGFVQGNSGKTDGWIIKVRSDFTQSGDGIYVHPNPSSGTFYLNELPEKCQFEVYDLNGRPMDTQIYSDGFAGVLDLSAYNPGVYILNVISDNERQTVRLVKQ